MARDGTRGRLLLVAPGDPAPHMKKVGARRGGAWCGGGTRHLPCAHRHCATVASHVHQHGLHACRTAAACR